VEHRPVCAQTRPRFAPKFSTMRFQNRWSKTGTRDYSPHAAAKEFFLTFAVGYDAILACSTTEKGIRKTLQSHAAKPGEERGVMCVTTTTRSGKFRPNPDSNCIKGRGPPIEAKIPSNRQGFAPSMDTFGRPTEVAAVSYCKPPALSTPYRNPTKLTFLAYLDLVPHFPSKHLSGRKRENV
jgi:hypothetical protein